MVSTRRLICRLTSFLWHMPLYSATVQTSLSRHTHTHAHTHAHTHTHARTHAHTHTHAHARTHARTHAHTHNVQLILAYLTATILHKKGRPAVTYSKIKEALHKEFQVCQQMVSNVIYVSFFRRANAQSRGSCTVALLF